jgi:hypothetical protein
MFSDYGRGAQGRAPKEKFAVVGTGHQSPLSTGQAIVYNGSPLPSPNGVGAGNSTLPLAIPGDPDSLFWIHLGRQSFPKPSTGPVRNILGQLVPMGRPRRLLADKFRMMRRKLVHSRSVIVPTPLAAAAGHIRQIFHDTVLYKDVRSWRDQARVSL